MHYELASANKGGNARPMGLKLVRVVPGHDILRNLVAAVFMLVC